MPAFVLSKFGGNHNDVANVDGLLAVVACLREKFVSTRRAGRHWTYGIIGGCRPSIANVQGADIACVDKVLENDFEVFIYKFTVGQGQVLPGYLSGQLLGPILLARRAESWNFFSRNLGEVGFDLEKEGSEGRQVGRGTYLVRRQARRNPGISVPFGYFFDVAQSIFEEPDPIADVHELLLLNIMEVSWALAVVASFPGEKVCYEIV